MLISAFITHKKAEHYSDCQDRFSINKDTKSIALSDGMSQSIFQKYWAEILVDKYTKNQNWEPNIDSVKKLSSIWRNRVEENIKEQKESGNKSVWRAERSLLDGRSAGATFLGIRFDGLKWKGWVLGDSCLVWVNDNRIKGIFTSEDVESFDSYPDFFDSNPKNEGKGTPKPINGTLETGDSLLLVSDPFSDFLLKNKGTKEESILIDRLLGVNSHEEFEQVVEQWREKGMHNDDSTLIIIKSNGADDFVFQHLDNIKDLINNEKPSECENKPLYNENIPEESEKIENSNIEINLYYEKLQFTREIEARILHYIQSEFRNKAFDCIEKSSKGWKPIKKPSKQTSNLLCEILQQDIKIIMENFISKDNGSSDNN